MPVNKQCHIIVVVGGKGGAGKSVLTANLALAGQKEMKLPTLLADLDQKSCGDQNVIMGIRSKYNVQQLSQHKGALNESGLKSFLASHPSGLNYLSAVSGPEQRLECPLPLFKKQLFNLSQFFRFIFIDAGCDIAPLQKIVLDCASAVLVVATPEILVVNQTKRLMSELSYLPSALFHLLLNRTGGASDLKTSAVSGSLRAQLLASFPEEAAFPSSLHSSKPFILSHPQSPWTKACYEVIRRLVGGILQKGKLMADKPKSPTDAGAGGPADPSQEEMKGRRKAVDPLTLLKMQIHAELIKEMDLKKDLTKAKDEAAKQELRRKTQTAVSHLVDLRGQDLSREQRTQIIKQVLDEALGLGVLEELLADPKVTEVMINGCDQIYCERSGRLQLSPHTVTSNVHLKNIIERIVIPLGRRIDEKTPYVDARLEDGSRVNAIIEPLSLDGPAVTIRKFPAERIVMEDYTGRFGSLTHEMGDFLKICVEQALNIVISGGTGSGKTTLLNVLSGFIPEGDRIITVEDAAELQLKQEHVVRLETRPANIEGTGAVSIRDLIRNSLRMRPDRIVVGECRDGAALDMLSAMNTGHDGSLTTVHANNPREAVARLETLCLMAGMELPAKAIREQIASAVHLIVQIGRLGDGSRKVKNITEVVGMQGDVVTLQEVFRFKEEGMDKKGKIVGQFQASGIIPSFIEKFEQRGLKIPRDIFTTKTAEELQKRKEAARPARPQFGGGRIGGPKLGGPKLGGPKLSGPPRAALKSPGGISGAGKAVAGQASRPPGAPGAPAAGQARPAGPAPFNNKVRPLTKPPAAATPAKAAPVAGAGANPAFKRAGGVKPPPAPRIIKKSAS